MKMPVFVDGNVKMILPSMKMADFVDGNVKMILHLFVMKYMCPFFSISLIMYEIPCSV